MAKKITAKTRTAASRDSKRLKCATDIISDQMLTVTFVARTGAQDERRSAVRALLAIADRAILGAQGGVRSAPSTKRRPTA